MPFDTSELPELSHPTSFSIQDSNAIADLMRKRRGSLGPIDYEFHKDKAKLSGDFNNAMAELMLRYNGDWDINVNSPLLGGNLDFSAMDRDGTRNYGLKYQRSF